MTARPRRSAWWLRALAGTGILSSHWAAYVIAAPDDHHRAQLLETTGHDYWPYALSLIVAGIVVAIAGFVATQVRDRTARVPRGRTGVFAHAAPRLLALQVAGFVALEVGERWLGGAASPADLVVEPAFLIGLGVQAVVAFAGAALLACLAYVVHKVLGRARSVVLGGALAPRFVSLVAHRRLLVASGGLTLRGPPVR